MDQKNEQENQEEEFKAREQQYQVYILHKNLCIHFI
jgi:hypothetical protein